MADDVYFANTPLLLNCNGADSSTTFTDLSYSPKTVTANGNAQVKVAQSVFGGASLRTDGTGDYLSVASTTDFDFGLGDFTIEFWARLDTATPAANKVLITKGYASPAAASPWVIFQIPSGEINFYASADSSTWGVVSALTLKAAPAANTWYHLAVTRESGVFRAFCDGVLTSSYTSAVAIQVTTGNIMIGGSTTSGDSLAGYMDDIRITKGVARYVAAFTPPVAEFEVPPPAEATADLTLPMMYMDGHFGAGADLSIPMLSLDAGFGIDVAVSLPMLTLDAYFGGAVEVTLPMLTLDAYGHDATGENSLEYTIPMFTLDAGFGASAALELPMLTLDAEATFSGSITADLTMPMLTLDAAGTGSPWVITADLTLPMLTITADFGASVALALPMLTIDAEASAGSVATVDAVLPMLTLDALVTAQTYGWADLTLPMLQSGSTIYLDATLPMLELDAYVSEVVVRTYEAYAVNLKHNSDKAVDEVTRYTNFPFTRIVRYKNRYYGIHTDGNLYLLEGSTDAGTAIPWSFKTGTTDFGSSFEKTVISAYFRGRMGASEKVQLYAGEKNPKVYSYSNPRGSKAQNYRQKFGRGIKDAYYALGASGAGVMDLDAIETEIHEMTRRI